MDGKIGEGRTICHMCWYNMVVANENFRQHHEGVAEAPVMGAVFELLSKKIAGVDHPRDVADGGVADGGDLVDLVIV